MHFVNFKKKERLLFAPVEFLELEITAACPYVSLLLCQLELISTSIKLIL